MRIAPYLLVIALCVVDTRAEAQQSCTPSHRCVVKLASGLTNPQNLATSGGFLYWATSSAIMRQPLAGGRTSTIVSGELIAPRRLAVGSFNVYWGAFNDTKTMPIAGGAPTTLARTSDFHLELIVGPSSVYWTECNLSVCKVQSAPLLGGAVTTVATEPGSLTAWPLAMDSVSLYWVSPSGVRRQARAGGPMVTLGAAWTRGIVYDILVDSANVYVSAGGDIAKMSVSGGAWTVLASQPATPPSSRAFVGIPRIAVDASFVYWVNPGLHTVSKVPISGGAVTTLATATTPCALVVDATSVYFADADEGTIKKITPK